LSKRAAGNNRAGLHESVAALVQCSKRPLERSLISEVIADPSGGCRQLLNNLWWNIVRERRPGRLKGSQGLLQRTSSTQQRPVPLQAPFFEQQLRAQQGLWRGGGEVVEQHQRLLG